MSSIAILGATSQIARDFIRQHLLPEALTLFSRVPEKVSDWVEHEGLPAFRSRGYVDFPGGDYTAIVNFVGSGDPARTAAMGAQIFDVTTQYDTLALDYLQAHRSTRYVFISSGAVYGNTFLSPVDENSSASFPINKLSPQDYYGVAKLYAEARHRALADLAITDIRVFAYFSRHTDLNQRFFVTDILRAVQSGQELETGSDTMRRDFITPPDFLRLVTAVLDGPPGNRALDAYSDAPVEKFALLGAMKQAFGLTYRVVPRPPVVLATGAKPEYFSTNRVAANLGYYPQFTSLDGVMRESRALLGR